jgi:Peroxidase
MEPKIRTGKGNVVALNAMKAINNGCHMFYPKLCSIFFYAIVVAAMVVGCESVTSDVEHLTIAKPDHKDIKSVRKLQAAGFLQATNGLQLPGYPSTAIQVQYEKDLARVNWTAVSSDLAVLLRDSKDWWPADYGTYGPLMMRLSWHACGSYRASDGRGGCDGGGMRYDPERSWPDNTNLDKARKLLKPIKLKYGNGVSWGDLFALVGTVAIREMGGPVIGFCAGRQDVHDNSQTLPLGPSIEQERFAQCPTNGQCPFPLGSNTLGLVRKFTKHFSLFSSPTFKFICLRSNRESFLFCICILKDLC